MATPKDMTEMFTEICKHMIVAGVERHKRQITYVSPDELDHACLVAKEHANMIREWQRDRMPAQYDDDHFNIYWWYEPTVSDGKMTWLFSLVFEKIGDTYTKLDYDNEGGE